MPTSNDRVTVYQGLLRDILDGKTTPALRELAAYRDWTPVIRAPGLAGQCQA